MAAACDLSKMKNVYFAGIGGVSMSSLALALKYRGINVSGYDMKESETTKMLEQNDIVIDYSFNTVCLKKYDTLIYTAAIKDDNPIIVGAKGLGINIFTRAELLGEITGNYEYSIGVAGTHGKSTTTGFLSQIMLSAANDATILGGAVIPALNSTFRIGKGDCAVFEACEYKNAYHSMCPNIKVVLNVDFDHVDFFGSIENVIKSFRKYIDTPGKNGKNISVVNLDSENAIESAKNTASDVRFFSIKQKADFWADNITFDRGYASFTLMKNDTALTDITLCVPGLHNVSNAVAAAAAAFVCNIDICAIKCGLEAFTGVKRRFEKVKVLQNGAIVIDDYAHHPDEIRATLTCAKQVTKGNVICIFQSHTYSRTKALLNEFASALSLADKVLLAPIYAAREINVDRVSSEDLANLIENAQVLPDFDALRERAKALANPDDLIITMGAGDIYKVFQE